MSSNRYQSRGPGTSARGPGGKGNPDRRSKQKAFPSGNARGLFADGVWHCDCTPRLPAEHFKVKKESKNKGRWFYTCQHAQDKRCGFFLWDEDAKTREEGAVLSNSRTEPERSGKNVTGQGMWKGMDAGGGVAGEAQIGTSKPVDDEETESEREISPPPPYASPDSRARLGMKRSADAAGLTGEDAFRWPLSAHEEEELVEAADSAAPETPRKAMKMGIYATPAGTTTVERKRRLPWLEEPAASIPAMPSIFMKRSHEEAPTPSKPSSRRLPPMPLQDGPATPHLPPPTMAKPLSPPTRYRDALANPADSASSLTAEVLAELEFVSVPPDIMARLRTLLSKHDLKTQGVIKGRDISRLALKAKDAKILELQARMASLEADREVERAVRRAERLEERQ